MLFAQFKLKDCITRLKNLKKNIKPEYDEDKISTYKSKFYGICLDLINITNEMSFLTSNDLYSGINRITREALEISKETSDGEEFLNNMDMVLMTFPSDYDYEAIDLFSLNYDKRRSLSSFCYIHQDDITSVINKIDFNNKTRINVLQPCCKRGRVLEMFKKAEKNVVAYGIEADSYDSADAKKVADRIAKGTIKGSKISNNVFDVLFLDLDVTWNVSDFRTFTIKSEKALIQDTNKFLKQDGIVIMYIPYFRLHQDMCSLIAKNYYDLQIRRIEHDRGETRKDVVIIGKKKSDKELDTEAYNLLRLSNDYFKIAPLSYKEIEKISVPKEDTNIEFFRGSVLDFEEMDELIEETKCYESFWKNQKSSINQTDCKQPLLPFNIGQIGLVLTSGCLDGIIKEQDGSCHLIKGRVSKKSETEQEVVNNKIEVKETISNKVEIKVFLPNGEYKTLA